MPTSMYFPVLELFPDLGHCAVVIQITSKDWLPDIRNAPSVIVDVSVPFCCAVVLYNVHYNTIMAAVCLRKRKTHLLPDIKKSRSEEGSVFLCRGML